MRIDSHHSFSERYTLDFLGSILKRNRFEGSILVVGAASAPIGTATVRERIMDLPDFVRGVVIEADLRDPDLPNLLDRCQRNPRFKGICHRFTEDTRGLAELERRGLCLDALASPNGVASIADRFPSLHIVLDHLGVGRREGEDWARDLERIARFPQVFCKLSGVTRLRPSPRPYVQHALAVLGPRRLMFGSDWPDCLPDATWKASLAAFTQAIGPQSIEVREELLGGTAERFYGLSGGSFTASV